MKEKQKRHGNQHLRVEPGEFCWPHIHFLNQGNWCLYGVADANRRNLEKEQGRLLARLM